MAVSGYGTTDLGSAYRRSGRARAASPLEIALARFKDTIGGAAVGGPTLGPTAGSRAPMVAPPSSRPGAVATERNTPADDWLRLRSDDEIRSSVSASARAQTDPLIAEIQAATQRRSQAGSEAITGYTRALAGALEGYEGRAQAAYADALNQQNLVNAALAQRMSEAAPDQPGASTALAATGSAASENLIAQGAAARSAMAAQPGIAARYGLQASSDLQSQLSREEADQLGQVRAQIPGLIESLFAREQGREDTKRGELTRRSERREDIARDDTRYRAEVARYGRERADRLRADRLARQDRQADTRRDAARVATADTGWRHVATTQGPRLYDSDPRKPGVQPEKTLTRLVADREWTLDRQPAPKKPAKVDRELSLSLGTWVDASGNPIPQLANRPVPKPPKDKPTPPKVDVTVSRALGTWVDSAGNPIPALRDKKVPKPAKDAPDVDLDLSISMGVYVDAAGRAIPSLRGKKPPKTKPSTKAPEKKGGEFNPSTGKYG